MTEKPLTELSTKEEVAEVLSTRFNFDENTKNIFLNEYISGDVLIECSEQDLKNLKFKLGYFKKIMKYLRENKENFKEIKFEEKIYPNSSPENIKQFFEKSIEFKGDLKGLDGKKMLEMTEGDMDNLGLKFGQKRRLIKYINYFKTLKPPPEEKSEEISISRKSSEEEVSKFLQLKLKFSKDSTDKLGLDGSIIFDLTETDIDALEEINSEEKNNLKNFLKESKDNVEPEIKITRQSSIDEIYNYLQKKLCFSDNSIKIMKDVEIDNDTFFDLTEKNIDEDLVGILESEKQKLKVFLEEFRKKIKIDNKSNKDEVINYLKTNLKFSENSLKNWKLDGQSLFSLTEDDIDKLIEISQKEKISFKNFINDKMQKPTPINNEEKNETTNATPTKEEKKEDTTTNPNKDGKILTTTTPPNTEGKGPTETQVTEEEEKKIIKEPKDTSKKENEENKKENIEIKLNKESKKEDIIKFLEKHNLNPDKLTKEDIDKISELNKEEKEILNNFLSKEKSANLKNRDNNENKDKEKLRRANKIQDVLFNQEKYPDNNIETQNKLNPKTSINKRKKHEVKAHQRNESVGNIKDKDKENNKDENIILANKVKESHINKDEQRSNTISYHQCEKLKNKPLVKSPFNIFFFFPIRKLALNKTSISTYQDESSYFNNIYNNINFNVISMNEYKNEKTGDYICFIFQIPTNKLLKNISITIKRKNDDYKYTAQIDTNSTQNYFNMENLKFDTYDEFSTLDINAIFSNYLDCFLSKKYDIEENLQNYLIKAIIKRISKENNIFKMRPHNFFRILKLSAKFDIEVKNIDCIEIGKKSKYKVDPEYFLSDEDIVKIKCARRKNKLIELIVGIYLKADTQHLMKLIKSNKIGQDICRSLLDLLNMGVLKLEDLKFSNKEDLNIFQKMLLSISRTKNEVQYTIKISQGSFPCL